MMLVACISQFNGSVRVPTPTPGGSDEGATYTLGCGHLGGELSISSFTTWPAQLYAPTKMTFTETLNAADGFVL